MKFSVIIPTFNRSKKLKEALDSLAAQNFNDFETIICDDGSTDDTKEIVELYKSQLRIKYYFEDNWGGAARPRNQGIVIAEGDWICFLDSDDQWHPNKLKEVAYVVDNFDVDLVCHWFKDSFGRVIGHYSLYPFFTFYEDLLMNGNRMVNSSICVRRSITPIISEDRKLIGVEDYNLLLDISKITAKVYCIRTVLGTYSIHENNISNDFLKQLDKIEYMLNKQDLKNQYLKRRGGLINYLLASYYFLGNKPGARQFLLKALRSGSYVIKFRSLVKLVTKF